MILKITDIEKTRKIFNELEKSLMFKKFHGDIFFFSMILYIHDMND